MGWPEKPWEGGWQLNDESITLKELLPIVLVCAVWGESLRNMRVTVHCDNLGAVALVNSGYSKIPQIMHFDVSFFIRARFQIQLRVPGIENVWADAISCNSLSLLYSGPQCHRTAVTHPTTTVITTGGSTAGLDLNQLDTRVQQLFSAGLAPATRKNYQSGTKRFLAFCQQAGIQNIQSNTFVIRGFPLLGKTHGSNSKELSLGSTLCTDIPRFGRPRNEQDAPT